MFLSMCDKIRSGQRHGVNDENDPTSSNCLDMFCQGLSIESTAEFLGDHCVIQTMLEHITTERSLLRSSQVAAETDEAAAKAAPGATALATTSARIP